MNEASKISLQMTFEDLDSATSSPALADGATRSDSPASPTISASGPAPARASHSRKRVGAKESPTIAISGPTGSASSASAALQSSLENRLRARMESRGCTLYALTWKAQAMPSGPPICRLLASVLRTSDNACSSWPTPTASRGDYSYREGNHDEHTLKPSGAAKLAAWPTATTRDWKSSASNLHEKNSRPLNEVARLASWATPNATGADRGGSASHIDGRRSNLIDQVQLAAWATPAVREAGGTPEQFLARKTKAVANGSTLGVSLTSLALQAQLADSGPTPNGSPAETARPGQLAPAHSLWLQGYPAAWDESAAVATRSSRKSPRRSSKRR